MYRFARLAFIAINPSIRVIISCAQAQGETV